MKSPLSPSRTVSTRAAAALAALALPLVLAGCSEDDAPGTDTASAPVPAPDVDCTYNAIPSGISDVEVPPTKPSRGGEIPVALETSIGTLNLTLDAQNAPCTTNSFTSLASQGYFDGTSCHRLTTAGIFVLQCGDPQGTGRGGPGYQFDDELDGDETYPAGTLAMANAGPGTNGSQFFVVYEDTSLPAAYTVFGSVDEDSLAAVRDAAAAGVEGGAGDGKPATEVTIESATVS